MQDLDFSEFEGGAGEAPGEAVAASAGPRVALAEPGRGGRRYMLLAPLYVDGYRLEEVTLRHLTQAELDDYAGGEIETRRLLLARVTGLHPDVIGAMIWPDSEALHQMFADLLPAFLKD
ncbi:phage tail assembly protein [Pseudorhizobium flavum]|uniref:phage tail assembly protein n=1 Tax=Pseudorhizobium flavum TaxID=1335061 RepID=UPI00248F7A6D|nr:phage tail assembly protein [Pseudorhizobium flavum]